MKSTIPSLIDAQHVETKHEEPNVNDTDPKDFLKYPNLRHVLHMPQFIQDRLKDLETEKNRHDQYDWDDRVRKRATDLKKYQCRKH